MNKYLRIFILSFLVLIFFLSCTKTLISTPTAKPPIANAGNSPTIQFPINTVNFSGTATTTNGNIVGYLWSLVSGPNVPKITSPSSAGTSIIGLIPGTYIYQFAAIDNIGLTGVDTVSVLVNPSLAKVITLQPANNLFEGLIDSYSPNAPISNGDTQFDIAAWTSGGGSENQRACLKIDFSTVPSNSLIDSAILYLYATPLPHGGNMTDANYGIANAGFIQRITNVWPGANNQYSWNNQPSVSTVNQVVIPQSKSSTSNAVLNVSLLVTDMLQFGNNGFFMQLQNEQTYNIQQFASSYNANAAVHPKLVIWYH